MNTITKTEISEPSTPTFEHLHGGTATPRIGAPLLGKDTDAGGQAPLAMMLIHGRGGSGTDILGLAEHLPSKAFAYLAPTAAGRTWYPYSFLAPMERNEPGLSSGLLRIDEELLGLADAGIPSERVILLGFSQGACLALEYAARHARRFGAVVAFSGGLIGPPGTARNYAGRLEGTPVFLGCSDRDAHVPAERVHESTAVLRAMGGEVEERIYPGMPHTIVEDELAWVRSSMHELEAAYASSSASSAEAQSSSSSSFPSFS